jgi:methyltransferase (TIGR00027 family)
MRYNDGQQPWRPIAKCGAAKGEAISSPGSSRAEGDSWDLASSVGTTATIVAVGRALASRGPEPLLDDRFAEPLVRAVGHDFFTRLLDGDITLDSAGSSLSLQPRREQSAVRTRFYDDFLIQATVEGARQVVILASGLDARAYRLAWPAGTLLFEIDQPEVIAFKTATLASLGAEPTTERRAIGVDLRDDWVAALRESSFSLAVPTAWIAEGLLMYLPPDAQDRLLDQVAELSAPGSSLAAEQFDDIRVFSDERAQAWRQGWRRVGLDIDIGDLVWPGERTSAGDFLASRGWDVTVHEPAELYAANGFELPDVDALAEFRLLDYVSAVLPQIST